MAKFPEECRAAPQFKSRSETPDPIDQEKRTGYFLRFNSVAVLTRGNYPLFIINIHYQLSINEKNLSLISLYITSKIDKNF